MKINRIINYCDLDNTPYLARNARSLEEEIKKFVGRSITIKYITRFNKEETISGFLKPSPKVIQIPIGPEISGGLEESYNTIFLDLKNSDTKFF